MGTKKAYRAEGLKYKTVLEKLDRIDFNFLAIKSEFKKRKHRKIEAKHLVISFMTMALKGRNTFQLWAEELGILTYQTLSKQAICKRMNQLFVVFLKLLLSEVFSKSIEEASKRARSQGVMKYFKNILVQDSTILCLPQWLKMFYPGNRSRGEVRALIKIQIIVELRSNTIVWFSITPYSKNDQSMSSHILDVAKKGDLVIRDLGYFTLKVFQKMKQQGLCFVSRIKPGVKVFDPITGMEINIAKTLKAKKRIDKWVLAGKEQKLPLRIVAIRLPDNIANEKIRLERKNRDRRLNHSEEYYELMRYNIYLTTEEQDVLSVEQLISVYGLRWRIETIFKTWKSYFHLQELIPCHIKTSKERVESIILLMLVFIIEFQLKIYNLANVFYQNKEGHSPISLAKLSKFIADRVNEIIEMDPKRLLVLIGYYCKYDKRKDRTNYNIKFVLS
jgi:hypothetical protein